MRAGRYFAVSLIAAIGVLAAAWVWIAAMPMAYLDPEFPYWRAKQTLLAACDLGQVAILGDSRAAADIVPSSLPVAATNFAVGGGKPIEMLAVVRRMLDCPNPPERVVLSLDIAHFTKPDLFWERTVRFGFLSHRELRELEAVTRWTGDRAIADARQPGVVPLWLRSALYAARFPPLYFDSLAKGGVFLRWFGNRDRYARGLAARGQYFFGVEPGSDAVAMDGHLDAFRPSPLLSWYFEQVLAALDLRGIDMDFVSMPLNAATAAAIRPEVRRDFAVWLARWSERYPRFRVAGEPAPAWPNRWFGDAFSHLNPRGAALYSAWFGACLADRFAGCDRPPAPTELGQTP